MASSIPACGCAMAEATMTQRRPSSKASRRFWGNQRTLLGLIVMGIIVLSAIFAPLLSTHDPNVQNLRNRLQPPSAEHWLGTDQFGRDTYSRIVWGGRVSLQVGFLSVAIALAVGGIMG